MRSLLYASILIAMGAGGALCLFGAAWGLARLARRYGQDDLALKPPVARFTGTDERLPQAAAQRRNEAAHLHQQAHALVSSPEPCSLRIVTTGSGRNVTHDTHHL